MTTKIHKSGSTRRRMVALVMTAGLMMLGAGMQSANAACQDEPFPGEIGIDVGPGVVYVAIDQYGGAGAGAVLCVNQMGFGADYDPTVTPGAKIQLVTCSGTNCSQMEIIGAEIGNSPTNGSTGRRDYAVWILGSPVGGAGKQTSAKHSGTVGKRDGTANLACVSSVCVKDFTLCLGTLTLWVNQDFNSPGTPVTLDPVLRIGPTAPASCN